MPVLCGDSFTGLSQLNSWPLETKSGSEPSSGPSATNCPSTYGNSAVAQYGHP